MKQMMTSFFSKNTSKEETLFSKPESKENCRFLGMIKKGNDLELKKKREDMRKTFKRRRVVKDESNAIR